MPLKSEPAVISAILLSDVSIIELGSQKRSVIGCFDQILVPKFPGGFPRFWITTWISNIVGTLSEMEVTCRLQDKSGHAVYSTTTKAQFPAETAFDNTATIGFSTPIENIVFARPGVYTIVILLNGEETGKRDFNVKEEPPKANL
jgi:hypothetical protein